MSRRFFFRLLSAAAPAGDHVPDAELLRRFAQDRDPAAFELLARRHADAVWTACRRVLRSDAEAEDAFQAAFLVLARKAGAVRGPCVGGWLYRVAVHAALKLRARSARVVIAPADQLDARPAPASDEPDVEVAAAVQEEVARLPERYRLPVVLCELEGHTHAEAAKVLGWPVGSVSGRLSRARILLRDRLTRRGLAPAAGAVAVLPTGSLPAGAIPSAVAAATGAAPVPMPVSILAEGVLSAMRTAKLKLTVTVVASVGLLGLAGVGTYTALGKPPAPPAEVDRSAKTDPDRSPTDTKPDGLPATTTTARGITAYPNLDPKTLEDLIANCPKMLGGKDVPSLPKDDALRQLKTARLNAVIAEIRHITLRLEAGKQDDFQVMPTACNRAAAAAADLFTDPKELRPWLEERVRVAKWYEKVIDSRVREGAAVQADAVAARYARLDAEIALYKLDQQLARKPGP